MDTPPQTPPQPQGVGPLAGAITIVLLLVVGGVYFFVMQESKLHSSDTATPTQANS